jgi:hypothetical protein
LHVASDFNIVIIIALSVTIVVIVIVIVAVIIVVIIIIFIIVVVVIIVVVIIVVGIIVVAFNVASGSSCSPHTRAHARTRRRCREDKVRSRTLFSFFLSIITCLAFALPNTLSLFNHAHSCQSFLFSPFLSPGTRSPPPVAVAASPVSTSLRRRRSPAVAA